MASSLAAVFLAAIGREAEGELGLESELQAICDAAQEAWPGLEIPRERYAMHLAERLLDPQGVLTEELAALDASALYLTCGCLLGLPEALQALETHFVGELDRVLSRFDGGVAQREEIKQRIRAKLLVAENGMPPRIGGYTGRGDLGRWLKVVASRESLAMLRKGKREVLADDRLLAEAVSPAEDQELAYLKQHYRREFKLAFHATLANLEARQRTLLRYQLLDGLSIDEIGVIFGVHRATAARWLERVRADLLAGTRERLMRGIKVDPAELDSIMHLIQSQLDVSIQRILVDEPD